MDIYNDLSTLINNLIQDFIIESGSDPLNLRQFAVQKNVLPIFYDWGGIFTINNKGDVVAFDFEDLDPPKLDLEHPKFITDPRIRNIAIFQGSKKFPELKVLIPVKPNEARVCPSCQGTGIESTSAKLNTDNIVCYCGGLGWIP